MSYYYAFDDGVVRGPVTAEVLKSLRLGDALRDDSPVMAHGEAAWSTCRVKLAQLVDSVAPPPLMSSQLEGGGMRAPTAPLPPPKPQMPVQPFAEAPAIPKSTSGKSRISQAAAQVAAGASHEKGEFDAVETIVFAPLSFGQGGKLLALGIGLATGNLASGDSTMPLSWIAMIRLFVRNGAAVPQLYLKVNNATHQGLVHYNRASLAGGESLEVTHINHERQRAGEMSWVTEHLGVELSISLLAAHLDTPLRLQVSRPDEGIKFVVELPSYYIAGVLYKLYPDRYEVDPNEPKPPVEKEEQGHGWQAVGAGVLFGLFFMFKEGFFPGLILGAFFGAAVYGVMLYKRKKELEKSS